MENNQAQETQSENVQGGLPHNLVVRARPGLLGSMLASLYMRMPSFGGSARKAKHYNVKTPEQKIAFFKLQDEIREWNANVDSVKAERKKERKARIMKALDEHRAGLVPLSSKRLTKMYRALSA